MPLVQVDSSSSKVGKVTVLKDSLAIGVRPNLNFQTGNNTILTVVDDSSLNAINIKIDTPLPGTGAATALATTGADVTVSAAAPPSASQVLTATTSTTASWQAVGHAAGVRSQSGNVTTSASPAPTSGQVLTAVTGTVAVWSTPTRVATGLQTATTVVDIASALPPSAGQVLTATGSTTATWQTPTGGGGGDNISVNGTSVVDADFDDIAPSAPADSLNVRWQRSASSPANISANLLMTSITKLGTVTTGAWNASAIPILYGGTGQTTQTGGFNALNPTTTKGDLIVNDGTNAIRLPAGTNAYVLTVNSGVAAGLEWASAGSIAVGERSKSITIPGPSSTDEGTVSFFHAAQTIVRVCAVLVGSDTPSVSWNLYKSSDRSAAGTKVWTAEQTTTSTTTGAQVTSFDSAAIGADNFLWFQASAVTGTVDEIHVTIIYTEP